MRFFSKLLLCLILSGAFVGISIASEPTSNSQRPSIQATAEAVKTQPPSKMKRVKPLGATGETFVAERKKSHSGDDYESWKRHLPFWPRKGWMLLELMAFISIGVLIGQLVEVLGFVKMISWVTLPATGLGKLSKQTGPAFLMAFQSGAVANSMLVSQRDSGLINNRELYTSVYVVSALSLFAHLPTFVVPIGVAFGWEATIALFTVRFGAIAIQIILTLLISRFVFKRLNIGEEIHVSSEITAVLQSRNKRDESVWVTVWKRSRKTLARLMLYLLPTFIVMATLEYYGMFKWLSDAMPQLFTFNFLPTESLFIIPAQALSLYNGAIAAANFIDSGAITTHQAVIIILFGSMVTAPVRTLRHALPTYVAVLGARPGLFMAISAQVLRMLFLLLCTAILMAYWF